MTIHHEQLLSFTKCFFYAGILADVTDAWMTDPQVLSGPVLTSGSSRLMAASLLPSPGSLCHVPPGLWNPHWRVLVTWDAPFLAVVLEGLWHPRVASVKKRGHRGKSRRRGPHRVTALPVGRPTWAASGSCCSPLDTAGAERRARSRGWGWHSLSPHCCDAARNPELCHIPGTWWGEALT